MSKRSGQAQIMSANALLDGAVVYYAPGGLWSPRLADALVAITETEAAALEAARVAAEALGAVVEPEIVPVVTDHRCESSCHVAASTRVSNWTSRRRPKRSATWLA